MRLGYALSSATLLVLLAVPAYAQTTTQSGFALNRFDPSERGSDWFALESLDLRGHNRWAVGVVGDWAYKPLVLYDSAGDLRAEARMPCGRAVDDKALKATPKGTVAGHFSPGGTLYNCQLSPDGSTLFQVIFENVPADYDATFEVKVMVVAATTG